MVLIVGGLSAGKRAYAQTLGYTPQQMSSRLESSCPVLYDLQALVPAETDGWRILLPAVLQKEVLICNEVGCGVVPIDVKERLWREEVGRLCIALARRATRVVRIQCGLPIVLK